MSYQVLARKWRPGNFHELVGQEHVMRALVNALDHQRLHHAYLFTGTRGVGKTTIARIFAKCLNCEQGLSSKPCGRCSACNEISQGRFVDLIEVDAASRTKVEDTREILDNVQYAPARGRYKIYLIDEVHMLSNHSFNALLKTLEEPPEHVKFLLATTDPQKLPVTILSRCLQFNLKNMSAERIVKHLATVLSQESVSNDEAALWLIARSANGSMRDALSLTDQAISYGNGTVAEQDVAAMLGTIDRRQIVPLMQSLTEGDGAGLLKKVAHFADFSPDYDGALSELTTLLHRIAIAQTVPDAIDNSFGDQQDILQFAEQLRPEDVQLFYQTALVGRRDLPLSPDSRGGFEMTLLRMLAFRPHSAHASLPLAHSSMPASEPLAQEQALPESRPDASAKVPFDEPSAEGARPIPKTHAPSTTKPQEVAGTVKKPQAKALASQAPVSDDSVCESAVVSEVLDSESNVHNTAVDTVLLPIEAYQKASSSEQLAENLLSEQASRDDCQPTITIDEASALKRPHDVGSCAQVESMSVDKVPLEAMAVERWLTVYEQLELKGVLQNTAANCVLIACDGQHFEFVLDKGRSSLFDSGYERRLAQALSRYFSQSVSVKITQGIIPQDLESPAMIFERWQQEQYAKALADIRQNSVVQRLQEVFNAKVNFSKVKLTKRV